MLLMLSLVSFTFAQDRVRAKIGLQIKSGDSITWAKNKDSIKVNDFLRVYVIPEEDAYIYLVYADKSTPVLLNSKTSKNKVEKKTVAIFPSEGEFYQTDGASPFENFTVICSPKEIQEISTLFNSAKASRDNWLLLEEDLTKRSKIDMSEKPDKPFLIAGNVRGLDGEKSRDTLLNELLTFSGKSFLVKRYEITIKK
jgi:hypothetical protein